MNAVPHEDTYVVRRFRNTLLKLDLNDYMDLEEFMEMVVSGIDITYF